MNTGLIARIDRSGPILLALTIATVAVIYVSVAYVESSRIHNVIFIIPMALIAVVLAALVFLRVIRAQAAQNAVADQAAAAEAKAADTSTNEPAVGALGIAVMMALLVAYAFSIPWIGFDAASMLFMAGCLWVQGERRPLVVATMSVIFPLIVTWLLINGARVPANTLFF
jgi:hypothetical protein